MRVKLDELANKLKADPAGNYIEIEGHTDSTGSTAMNERLGLARAENVKRYLYETYQIPLHKINVISYGEDKPVAPNNTRAGRAQNRRVVIKVLALVQSRVSGFRARSEGNRTQPHSDRLSALRSRLSHLYPPSTTPTRNR